MRSFTIVAVFWLALAILANEPSGFHVEYGEVDGQLFQSKATSAEIEKTPLWSPDTEQAPPLPPGRAQAIARKQLERIIPAGQTWYLDAIHIVQAGERTHWLYDVFFRREYPPDTAVHAGRPYGHFGLDGWLVYRAQKDCASLVSTRHQGPNQALELTATRRVFTFQMIKTALAETTLALGGGSSALSR